MVRGVPGKNVDEVTVADALPGTLFGRDKKDRGETLKGVTTGRLLTPDWDTPNVPMESVKNVGSDH